jgi:ribA/ribD-fused uncharacterized protein
MQNKINGFFGKWRFLSNFWECPITFEGLEYPSVENAYQAAKTLDIESRNKFQNITPKESKSLGKKIEIRGDWEMVKLDIMLHLSLEKFTRHSHLGTQLIETDDSYLEESNWWRDTFWGTHNGIGENNLGKILMKVRDIIK